MILSHRFWHEPSEGPKHPGSLEIAPVKIVDVSMRPRGPIEMPKEQVKMRFLQGAMVKAARDVPPKVARGDIGWIDDVSEFAGHYFVNFGDGELSSIFIEESGVMPPESTIAEAAPPAPVPMAAASPSPPPAPPPIEDPGLAHIKARLITRFEGDMMQIHGYRQALIEMLETVYRRKYVPPVEAQFLPIEPPAG